MRSSKVDQLPAALPLSPQSQNAEVQHSRGMDAEYPRNVDRPGQSGIDEIFRAAGEYIKADGTFDLETAKADYNETLKNAPEKNKMYLQQSSEAVTYEQRGLKQSPFGYSPKDDKIYFDPSKEEFLDLDFGGVNTHELAHRIDTMFVQSWENSQFSQAIAAGRDVVAANPERFIAYCAENDLDGFLSDIISAICEDDFRLEFYHDKAYWKIGGNKEREIFANLFSLETFGDIEKIEFIAEYFPEIMRAYYEIISIL